MARPTIRRLVGTDVRPLCSRSLTGPGNPNRGSSVQSNGNVTAKGAGVSRQEAIRGERIQALPRASQTYPEGRTCASPGCGTKLSKYNRRDKCWSHADIRIPRLRGRKPLA